MKKIMLVVFCAFMLFAVGCSKSEAESKSIEQLYKENGVPVKVQSIKTRTFEKSLNYSGVLTGIKQTSAHAAFGDEVEKVHVKVGDYVKKDQVLVSFPTDAPSAQYNQAKVGFESIEKNLQKDAEFTSKGAISQQDFDNVETQYEVTKANWETVRDFVKVKAPISGYVTKVSVNETDNVRGEAELVMIANTDQLKTRIFVTEKDYPSLNLGQTVKADWNGMTIFGKVTQIDRTKDIANQGFGVMMEFDNPTNKFPSGITCELHIVIESRDNAIVIDKKYITTEGKNNFVYIVSDGKVVEKSVTLGDRQELCLEITKGLNAGENLIVQGHKMVKDGQKVNVVK